MRRVYFYLLILFFHAFSFTYASPPSDGSPCSAGPDRVICSASTQLEGSGLQGKAVWTVLSAPEGGTVAFADSLDPLTQVSFSKKGTYVLRAFPAEEAFASCTGSEDGSAEASITGVRSTVRGRPTATPGSVRRTSRKRTRSRPSPPSRD